MLVDGDRGIGIELAILSKYPAGLDSDPEPGSNSDIADVTRGTSWFTSVIFWILIATLEVR